ncbi:prepilin-type N-terminal cleavage/methylation domain-containing protein [Paenibacillus sp. L3-i20]|uniref:prepilin-type N-terminal cleavage/methylation domain-containing protein n=1 Tax=Paenibacillus sp. L3-i20 TaxID=2905833 RepID=UPI001EE0B14E|nr:prepilin-type N-terminal cleavage/methylation domain-containing protein [Paenibacillus sp. L3-i20]GKU79902.1 hypothetical protein L3i20_v242990 [Paenibacillus sp. L3-i20]
MLAVLKRNEKGLTLIELLAVLVIVGIIAAIAIPAIGNTIANSKENADKATAKLIVESAQRYILDLETNNTTTATTTIAGDHVIATTLVAKGYLVADPSWNNTANKRTIFNVAADPTGNWKVTLKP